MTRVLVVDDQASFRRLLRQLLTRAGLSVVGEAEGIQEAKVLVRALEPDLAVVDVMLPGIDGIKGSRRLRALRPSMRVILVSSFVDRADVFRTAAENAGADAFYPKDELDVETVRTWDQARQGPSTGQTPTGQNNRPSGFAGDSCPFGRQGETS